MGVVPLSHKDLADTSEGMRHHLGGVLPPASRNTPGLGGVQAASGEPAEHRTLDPALFLPHTSHLTPTAHTHTHTLIQQPNN
eukprot:782887-Rhodomonas_salina.1